MNETESEEPTAKIQAADIAVPALSWSATPFKATPDTAGGHIAAIPDGVVIFTAEADIAGEALGEFCRSISLEMPFVFRVNDRRHYAYRLPTATDLPDRLALPEGIDVWRPGHEVSLPARPPRQGALPVLSGEGLTKLRPTPLQQEVQGTELDRYSLRGLADEFEKNAIKAEPLLGEIALAGQATVLFAPPNAGKTLAALKLLNDAVMERRVEPGNVYYINADDNSEGVAAKLRLMDDLGVHTLVPGQKGFLPRNLPALLTDMAKGGRAKGVVVIIDTLKKVASLMDKAAASQLTEAVRLVVGAGGTVVGFAHTNKQPKANGKLQFTGTTDVRDDFDAAYIITPIDVEGFEDQQVIEFECIKSRGPNVPLAHYAYDKGKDATYPERLASFRLVAPDELKGFGEVQEEKGEAEIIATIEELIQAKQLAKMALAKEAAERCGASQRAVIRVIEAHTGNEAGTARWSVQRKARGAHVYSLLQLPADPSAEPVAQAA